MDPAEEAHVAAAFAAYPSLAMTLSATALEVAGQAQQRPRPPEYYQPRGLAVLLPERWTVPTWRNPRTGMDEGLTVMARYVTFWFRMLKPEFHPDGGCDLMVNVFDGPVTPEDEATYAETGIVADGPAPVKPEGKPFQVLR